MNIDTRYEETEMQQSFWRIAQIVALLLYILLLFGCTSQSDKSVSNAANQCYPNGLYAYVYHGGTGSLQVVCK